MMEINDLTYEQVTELEKNIKLKDKAKKIVDEFYENIKLNIKDYKGKGRFDVWNDSHNNIYIYLKDDKFYFRCNFFHETYDVEVTYSGVFQALKNGNRGIGHLESHIESIKRKS